MLLIDSNRKLLGNVAIRVEDTDRRVDQQAAGSVGGIFQEGDAGYQVSDHRRRRPLRPVATPTRCVVAIR